MKFSSTLVPYGNTGLFTPLIQDYVQGKETASYFAEYEVSYEGIKQAIAQRKNFPCNRKILVAQLQKQYEAISKSNQLPIWNNSNQAVAANVELLNSENTFTITTAHQPNIFTGPLYFFYKIIHAIQLASDLKKQFPENNFVPVYYMGSEDADIEEVGSFVLDGSKYQWVTQQTGAIGRMLVDDQLITLLQNMEGYWAVKPKGKDLFQALKNAYQKGVTINQATLHLVHNYFGQYGLVVLQPDDTQLKSLFVPIMEKELTTQFSHSVIQPTLKELSEKYHVQSEGRTINLFYLKDNIRARIQQVGEVYEVLDTDFKFTQQEIINELHTYPERFSPNVILRGVYQELILPGVAFIGGGGELAYWMELKNVFKQAGVHYPVMQLRNSFVFLRQKYWQRWNELGFTFLDLFKSVAALEIQFVKKHATQNLNLSNFIAELKTVYEQIKQEVIKVDPTLGLHTINLGLQADKKIAALEKKMVRSEKRKQAEQIQRIHSIKQQLFPMNSLQERVENFSAWVSDYGWDWVEAILNHSNTIAQSFTIITIEEEE